MPAQREVQTVRFGAMTRTASLDVSAALAPGHRIRTGQSIGVATQPRGLDPKAVQFQVPGCEHSHDALNVDAALSSANRPDANQRFSRQVDIGQAVEVEAPLVC